ncbi:Hypothetical predicted protein, partial [Olea europaea subsp. europaea]
MKSKFADLKRKFKSESETTPCDETSTSTPATSTPLGGDTDEDLDMVEMAQEAGLDDTLKESDSIAAVRERLAFSCIPHTSCRTPGMLETLGTLCLQNVKLFVLSVALVGVYMSVYPLLVAFLLGSLFAMEIQSILDWIKETFYVWTDSNSRYLITSNPYFMTKPVPIFDKKSMKPLQPQKIEYE